MDDLIEMQFFTYKRKSMKNGRLEKVKIRCKICGLSSEGLKERIGQKQAESLDVDGAITLRISGCEYKIDTTKLKRSLEYLGGLKPEPKEEVFVDSLDKDGTNRTGVYVVNIFPHSETPELIPIN